MDDTPWSAIKLWLSLGLASAAALWLGIGGWLVETTRNLSFQKVRSIEILDAYGGALPSSRWIDSRLLPMHVVRAFLAAEDAHFFDHLGFEPLAIARAAWINLRAGRYRQGASTITQQLTRLTFLSRQRRLSRKTRELLGAMVLEARLSKDEILSHYLSSAYFGNGAIGLRAAAHNYFRKSPTELNASEAALLAGLLRAPRHLDPGHNLRRARQRQFHVLRAMVRQGWLASMTAQQAYDQPLTLHRASRRQRPLGYAEAMVHQRIRRQWTGESQGLRVFTTLDTHLSRKSHSVWQQIEAVWRGESTPKPTNRRLEGALVVSEAGAVRALQGGFDFRHSQFNRALWARRPLGTTVLPLLAWVTRQHGFSDRQVTAWTNDPQDLLMATGARSARQAIESLGVQWISTTSADRTPEVHATPLELAAALEGLLRGPHCARTHIIQRVTRLDGSPLWKHPSRSSCTMATTNPHHSTLSSQGSQRPTTPITGFARHDAWIGLIGPKRVIVAWIGAEFGKTRLAPGPGVRAQRIAKTARLLQSLTADR